MTISKGYRSLLLSMIRKERAFILYQLGCARLAEDDQRISDWSEDLMSIEGLLDEVFQQED